MNQIQDFVCCCRIKGWLLVHPPESFWASVPIPGQSRHVVAVHRLIHRPGTKPCRADNPLQTLKPQFLLSFGQWKKRPEKRVISEPTHQDILKCCLPFNKLMLLKNHARFTPKYLQGSFLPASFGIHLHGYFRLKADSLD